MYIYIQYIEFLVAIRLQSSFRAKQCDCVSAILNALTFYSI